MSMLKRSPNISGVNAVTQVMQIGNVTLYNGNKKTHAFVATAVNFTQFAQVFPDRFIFEDGEPPEEYRNDTIVIGYKVNYQTENNTVPFATADDNVTVTIRTLEAQPFPHYELWNYTFSVAGTLQKRGTPGITNFDYWVFIPLETAREMFDSQESDLIFVKIFDPEESERIADEIESIFPPFKVTILVPLTFIRQVDRILTVVQLFLMAVASVSLLVAGIGIMNIMTVSVMERIREIGILKAIGAKSRTVLSIFLMEAVLVGAIGGLIGIVTGYGLSYLLAYGLSEFVQPEQQNTGFQVAEPQRMTINPIFTPEWTVAAFIFAVVVCIIFGLYPARKAAKLDPVEALRYE